MTSKANRDNSIPSRVLVFPGDLLVESSNKLNAAAAFSLSLLAYSILLLAGPYVLQDPDTLWHIRTGQWILQHAQVPTVDFYSYTFAGKPWISTEWLAEVLYAAAFNLAGWRGVTIVAITACAAIVGIVCFYLLRYLRFTVAVGWAVAAAAATSPHFIARPHILSYVILAIWIINLLDAYDQEKPDIPRLVILAPLMVIWANIHGSFTFGLTLLAIFSLFCLYHYFLQRNYVKCRRIVIVAVAVALCSFLTPYGMLPALMTTKLVSMKFVTSYIIEWQTPNFQETLYRPIYLVSILSAIAGLGIRLRGARLVVYALITFTGLRYIRGLLMFFFVVPIVLARPAGASARFLAPEVPRAKAGESDEKADPILAFLQRRSTAVVICLCVLAIATTASMWWRHDILPPKRNTPEAALDFVRSKNISGNVFNDYQFGGYLIWSGIPTFIDGRAELFGDDFVRQYSETDSIADFRKAFKVLDDYKVNWVILTPQDALTHAITTGPWDEVYSDKDAVVFVRRQ
jgi:hypothetical protein